MQEHHLNADILSSRLLLHTETSSGDVVPVWEDVHSSNIADLREIMDSKRHVRPIELSYVRIPITAERPPGLYTSYSGVPPVTNDIVVRSFGHKRVLFEVACILQRCGCLQEFSSG